MATSVALLYGFAEGQWHSKRMRAALTARGFEVVQDPGAADVVLTHSGGCFNAPPARPGQLFVHINPTYWPGKSNTKRFWPKLRQDLGLILRSGHPLFAISKLLHNMYYIPLQWRKTRNMVQDSYSYNLEDNIQSGACIIRNTGDPWMTPDSTALLQKNPTVRVRELPGGHDDCWLHPEPYVNLIQSELKEYV